MNKKPRGRVQETPPPKTPSQGLILKKRGCDGDHRTMPGSRYCLDCGWILTDEEFANLP